MRPVPRTTYAWCFDHGATHQFRAGDKPWCTARWVAFVVASEADAIAAKEAAYGDARFFDQLPGGKKLEVIDIRETWRDRDED
ncbi:hypothetical protein [Streptomyces sp. SID10815]|uniref:hypothetical protein n=1 Tax=Streptomyces sp. SID10815 TaxID=2706027 RepID=UPI0013CA5F93|nr:hypothetical protein [Streptomyces sp. SID10815]NEA52407.1 hypothetical protein [Streptomyces sp. SID10815]